MNGAELHQKLAAYLESDANFRAVYNYTKQRFEAASNLTAHTFEHACRDTINSIYIGEAEHADMAIVLPAMIMHDIGFLYGGTGRTHGSVGADNLSDYLKKGGINLPPGKLGHITDCIRTHKGSAHGEEPATLEARVVSDADMLDKFGPVGIYQVIRVFAEFGGDFNQTVTALDNPKRHFQTSTGEKLGSALRPFNDQFIKALREAGEIYQENPS